MSISTGDSRRSSKATGKEAAGEGAKPTVRDSAAKGGALPRGTGAAAAKATAAARSTTKSSPGRATGAKKATASGARRPAPSGAGKGRKPFTPVKVNTGRNWGPIAMFGVAGLVAVAIIAFGAYALISRPDPSQWKERALAISGIANYLESNPEYFAIDETGSNHKAGSLSYPTNPPMGGNHNSSWQNCMGDVYPAEIPKEQAIHSLEHGAVWVTYRPDLPQDQIDRLAERVSGKSYTFLSPYPSLDRPISLQAWGYQLKVDDANDERIDTFIDNLRINAAAEKGATCSSGITATGSAPLDLGAAPMG